jgi:hypothetical protein
MLTRSSVHCAERIVAINSSNALQVLRCLRHCTTPTAPINCTGTQVLSVRALAEQFGERFGKPARFSGREADTALLSDTTLARSLFGEPLVPLPRLLDWVADWVARDGATYGKPTKFEVRDGGF